MFLLPKKSNFNDYFNMYLFYTVTTSLIIIVIYFLSNASLGTKLIVTVFLPFLFLGTYLVPAILGIFLNKVIKSFNY